MDHLTVFLPRSRNYFYSSLVYRPFASPLWVIDKHPKMVYASINKGRAMPYKNIKNDTMRRALRSLDVALDERDTYTRAHSNRLVRLAEKMGEACGLSDKDNGLLRVGALLHDIGKIGIPDGILLKTSTLSPEEWTTIKTHPTKGERIAEILKLKNGAYVSKIIRHHHENFDGTGYPDGLSGEDIPYYSRIITVIDCYDAMTSTRPYAEAKSHQEALDILYSEEGQKNDPYLLRKFVGIIGAS